MKEIIVTRKSDGAKFEIMKKNGKYLIMRHKEFCTRETILEQAYLTPLALYGQDTFDNVVQTYKYLKEWIDWFH